MADSGSSIHLGFLTIVREPAGFVGGYLVTNSWGRPMEFRLSSAVQPNRVQQILYGESLEPYICGELVGKTLVEKTATLVKAIFTDNSSVLEVRSHVSVPAALVKGGGGFQCHPRFAVDAQAVQELLEKLGPLDLSEPFTRIREAIVEARKTGAMNRAA